MLEIKVHFLLIVSATLNLRVITGLQAKQIIGVVLVERFQIFSVMGLCTRWLKSSANATFLFIKFVFANFPLR